MNPYASADIRKMQLLDVHTVTAVKELIVGHASQRSLSTRRSWNCGSSIHPERPTKQSRWIDMDRSLSPRRTRAGNDGCIALEWFASRTERTVANVVDADDNVAC
jgi:hypothetical protein